MGQGTLRFFERSLLASLMSVLIVLAACMSPSATEQAPPVIPVPESTTPPDTSLSTPSQRVPRLTIAELLRKMETGANIVVVDTRTQKEYDTEHIKGAVSVPLAAIIAGEWLPPADQEVIFYCA